MPQTQIEMQIIQRWPEHADHDIRYSEYGRTDYKVTTIILNRDEEGDCMWVDPGEYDNRPCDGDVTETEMWCADCGVVLS